ncbi:MAG TPA: NAD/NADP octopine/nopaline dehydrogenase family protein [Candidatus Saccharimonadales bacterium]|nr:NAD/NADP octopine/nopaline dehydrogenase family protein [Candidatus Saccharimonadales bacterium]
MAIKKIAVLGAGNGGCAAAADLTLRGFEVRLFARSESTIAKLAKLGEIELIEGGVSKKAAPYFMSPHLPPVVQGVDLIVIATPAVGHEYLAKGLAKYLVDGQRILLNPGHTGGSLHFAHLLRQLGCKAEIRLCETVTLTYICRMPQPGQVEIYRRTTNLRCAALPGKHTDALVGEIQSVFSNVVAAANVLETGFSNINAIMHPAGMLGNAGWIEKTGGDFLYYREGITPAIGAWIDALDQERLAIVRALGISPLRFVDIFHGAGLTTTEARDRGSAYQAIHESRPNFTIKSPPSLDHRYIKEDVGYGLVPMAEVGKLLGLKTPVMDALITLASVALGSDFRVEGLTLDKMGLAGVVPEGLQKILIDGF